MSARARLIAPALLVLLTTGACSSGDGGGAVDVPESSPAASATVTSTPAPLTGVTLPDDPLVALVPQPKEVPTGLTPLLKATGARDLATVAGYSGTGAAQQAAAASLRAHGFVHAYTVQYADPATGRVLSVLVSQFATAAGATADLASDLRTTVGAVVPSATLGEQSSVQIEALRGADPGQLVLVRFRRGVHTWSLAYEAAPTAEPSVATGIVTAVLARTAA